MSPTTEPTQQSYVSTKKGPGQNPDKKSIAERLSPSAQRLPLLLSSFCLNIFVASLRTVSETSLLFDRLLKSPTSMFFISPRERSSGVRGLKTSARMIE